MIRQGLVLLHPINSQHLTHYPLDVGRVVFQLLIKEALDTESEANSSLTQVRDVKLCNCLALCIARDRRIPTLHEVGELVGSVEKDQQK